MLRVFFGRGSTFLALLFWGSKDFFANIMPKLGPAVLIHHGMLHNSNLNLLLEVFIFSKGPHQYKNRGRFCPHPLSKILVGGFKELHGLGHETRSFAYELIENKNHVT